MVLVIGTVTCLSGASLRVTFTWTEPPSGAVYVAAAKLTVTAGTSSSVMFTVAWVGLMAKAPVGMLPNPSLTLSSSSSTVSWVALKVKVFSVSPLFKVTLVGTE